MVRESRIDLLGLGQEVEIQPIGEVMVRTTYLDGESDDEEVEMVSLRNWRVDRYDGLMNNL